MVIFLTDNLSYVIRVLMRKFIQDSVLLATSTNDDLLRIDVTEKESIKLTNG